jgi:hypothetical protein
MSGPSLPLPIGFRIDSGDPPVVTYEDVEAAMPTFLQSDDPRAVRDALFNALTVILQTFQMRGGHAAALSDVLRSVDEPLQQIGRERGIFWQPGDTNETLRARILTAPAIVTPAAIIAAANTIFAPYTTVLSKYYESLSDRWYIGGATAGRTWASYIYANASEPTQSPNYPERLYQGDAAANAGLFCPQRDPGNVRTFKDSVGRYFVLRVPDISPIDTGGVFVSQESSLLPPPAPGWYVSDGASSANSSFLRVAGAASIGVYTQLCNVVDRIKGHSIRWMMVADAALR